MVIKKKKKLAFKLSKRDKTFGIKNAAWKKGFIVTGVLIVSLFILEQVRLYYLDQQLRKDYEELINIPSDWKFVDSELVGDPYCSFGSCRQLNNSYEVSKNASDTQQVFDNLVKLNARQFSVSSDACKNDVLGQRCVSPVIENSKFTVWVSLHSSVDKKIINVDIGLQPKP